MSAEPQLPPSVQPFYRKIRNNKARPDGLPYSMPMKELRERTRCTPEGLLYRMMHYERFSGLVSFGGTFYEYSPNRQGWQRIVDDCFWSEDLARHLRFEARSFREDGNAMLNEGVAPTVEAVFEYYRLHDYAFCIEETSTSLSRHAAGIVRGLHKFLGGPDRMPAPLVPTEAERYES